MTCYSSFAVVYNQRSFLNKEFFLIQYFNILVKKLKMFLKLITYLFICIFDLKIMRVCLCYIYFAIWLNSSCLVLDYFVVLICLLTSFLLYICTNCLYFYESPRKDEIDVKGNDSDDQGKAIDVFILI